MQLNETSLDRLISDFEWLSYQHDDRTQATAYMSWVRKVWRKHAIKSPNFNADVGAFFSMLSSDSHRFVSNAARYYVKSVDTGVGEWGTTDSLRMYVVVQDTQVWTEPQVPLFLHGVSFGIAGRGAPRELSVEFNIEWSDLHYARKDGIVFVGQDVARNELTDLFDWWRNNELDLPKDITRLSVAQAKASSAKWHKKLASAKTLKLEHTERQFLGNIVIKQARRDADGKPVFADDGSAVFDPFDYEVFKLLTVAALQNEGAHMRNCLGSYGAELQRHECFASIQGKDRNDSFTLHYNVTGQGLEVKQVRGFANRTCSTTEVLQIKAELARLLQENP